MHALLKSCTHDCMRTKALGVHGAVLFINSLEFKPLIVTAENSVHNTGSRNLF